MRTNKILTGGWVLAAILALSSCSTSRQVTLKDDMYNTKTSDRTSNVYQSPDYYYSDGTVSDQNHSQNNGYYADDYSDQEYNEGGEYDDLEYANRINRFYYASPGMTYYDPFFDPWYGYGGFGMGFGWNNWGWNNGFSVGFGWGWNRPYYGWGNSYWGSPYYGYGWGNPYYGGGYWGMNSYYNNWGHPYYGNGYYGGGYYGGGYYNNRPNRTSVRSDGRDRFNTRVPNNGGVRDVSTSSRRGSNTVIRDDNGRIVTGSGARGSSSRRGSTEPSRGSSATIDRNGTTDGSRRGATVPLRGSGQNTTIRPTNPVDQNSTNGSRGSSSRLPSNNSNVDRSSTSRPATSNTSRRGTSSPATSRGESYTPPTRSSNQGSTMSSPPSRSSSGSTMSSGSSSRSSGSSSSGSSGGSRSSGSSRR